MFESDQIADLTLELNSDHEWFSTIEKGALPYVTQNGRFAVSIAVLCGYPTFAASVDILDKPIVNLAQQAVSISVTSILANEPINISVKNAKTDEIIFVDSLTSDNSAKLNFILAFDYPTDKYAVKVCLGRQFHETNFNFGNKSDLESIVQKLNAAQSISDIKTNHSTTNKNIIYNALLEEKNSAPFSVDNIERVLQEIQNPKPPKGKDLRARLQDHTLSNLNKKV